MTASRTNELSTRTRFDTQLDTLRSAESDTLEAFVAIGATLAEIKESESYRQHGYTDWQDACGGPEIGYSKRQADRLILCSRIRTELLPEMSVGPQWSHVGWSVSHVRELARLPADADIRRVAKKIVTRMKKQHVGCRETRKLVDDELGVTRKTKERKARELLKTLTPAETLREIEVQVILWKQSLEAVSGEFWTDAESDDKGCVKQLANTLSALASYLRG